MGVTTFKNSNVKELALEFAVSGKRNITQKNLNGTINHVCNHKLKTGDFKNHVMMIVDSETEEVVGISPFFKDLRSYTATEYFYINPNREYVIYDITDVTGKDVEETKTKLVRKVDTTPKIDLNYFNGYQGEKRLFKEGDRVHVSKINYEHVDFYATLIDNVAGGSLFEIVEATKPEFNGMLLVSQPTATSLDAYELVTDGNHNINPYVDTDHTPENIDDIIDDVVNKPSHYTFSDKFEVIDIVSEISKQYPPELSFAIGNVIKYISRAEHKSGKQDLQKAEYYLRYVIENYKEE